MRERLLAGDPYRSPDPEIDAEMLRAAQLTHRFNGLSPDDEIGRQALLAELFRSLGEETVVRPPLYCDFGSHISVGSRVYINLGLTALDVAPITIGNDVLIGPNVQLLTPTHPLEPEPRRLKWEAAQPIIIGDNVWIGGAAVICPGVTIGDNSIVGAGSVVTKQVPPNVVVAGNPARRIRSLDTMLKLE
jgi:maltose O-acetyltransferase